MSNTATNDSKTAGCINKRLLYNWQAADKLAERFCDGLKKGLKSGVGEVGKLKRVVSECYSEYLLQGDGKKSGNPPDAGLGMLLQISRRCKETARSKQDETMGRIPARKWTERYADPPANISQAH